MRTIGVYCITCLPTKKVYIGSSVCAESRFLSHRKKLKAGRHHSRKLQKAWDSHGEEAFEFEVIETFPSEVGLRERERELIIQCDAVRDGFNAIYDTEFKKPDRILKFNEKGQLLNRCLRMHEKRRVLQIGQKAFVEEMELSGTKVKRKRVKAIKKRKEQLAMARQKKSPSACVVWAKTEPYIIRK